nr:cytochrome c oxidase subunit 2 [Haematoloechus sp. CW13H]
MVLYYSSFYLDILLYLIFVCVFIFVFVFVALFCVALGYNDMSVLSSESMLLEFIWTFIPTVIVSILCFLNTMYYADLRPSVSGLIKVVGCQWYWHYDVSPDGGSYDSIMSDFIDSVGKPLRVLLDTRYILLVTSADVIHSFAVPAFNIKVDGIPGRINQVFFCPDRLGVFVGYCSELCGAGHAYMPIVVEVVKKKV